MSGDRNRDSRAAVRTPWGFTVIEVVIVLAISGGLFAAAVLMIAGRQNQTAFDQATRQVQSQIQQVLNEVSTGFFPDNGNFTCTAVSASQPPALASGATAQGSNTDCIFVGKALQFKVADSDPERFAVYTIAGLKRGGPGGGESTSLADARPVLVAPTDASQASAGYPDISVEEQLRSGLAVARMWYRDELGADHDIGAVAFINSFGSYGGVPGELLSGSGSITVIAADNTNNATGLSLTTFDMVRALNSGGGNRLVTGVPNPQGGVFICFESGGTDDYAIVRIGGESRDLSVTLTIRDKGGAACTYP